MTSEQTMLARPSLVAAALALALCFCGCASEAPLKAPEILAAPYERSDVIWAVAPLRNESGTTLFDPLDVTDKLVAAAGQIRGVRVVPLNRTIAVMRGLKMNAVTSPADARRIAQELGVDGLIVGSITAYDPYDPPKLGLSLALFARPGAMDHAGGGVDSRVLSQSGSGTPPAPGLSGDAPASAISEFLDGKNHQVLMDLKGYADGRHDKTAALSWRRYLASMDLFSEFAAWHAVGRLLDQEWVRLARVPPDENGTR